MSGDSLRRARDAVCSSSANGDPDLNDPKEAEPGGVGHASHGGGDEERNEEEGDIRIECVRAGGTRDIAEDVGPAPECENGGSGTT